MLIRNRSKRGGVMKSQSCGFGELQSEKGLSISMDAFEGFGESYKERESELIQVRLTDGTLHSFTLDEFQELILKNK